MTDDPQCDQSDHALCGELARCREALMLARMEIEHLDLEVASRDKAVELARIELGTDPPNLTRRLAVLLARATQRITTTNRRSHRG